MQPTYDEIVDLIDKKCFPSERKGYTLPVGMYEISDINNRIQHLLPDIVKKSITIDDIRLQSNLKTNQLSFSLKNLSSIQN